MKSAFLVSSLASLAAAVCHHGTTLFPRAADKVKVADFGFNELLGPLNWHGLAESNEACALGRHQSPVNIESAESWVTTVEGKTLGFDIQSYPHGAEFENLGSTVEVIANGTLTRDGKKYDLKQFHFHTPSEHRIESEYYPMEVHFVFQAEDEEISVVGFMIEVGRPRESLPLLDHVFEHLEEIREPGSVTETAPLDFADLKRHLECSTVYQYGGSLTTPPCSEGLKWNVVKEPVYLSFETFKHVKSVLKFNARYTQNTPGEINLLDNARLVLDGQH